MFYRRRNKKSGLFTIFFYSVYDAFEQFSSLFFSLCYLYCTYIWSSLSNEKSFCIKIYKFIISKWGGTYTKIFLYNFSFFLVDKVRTILYVCSLYINGGSS